jgi:hypothetical protein
LRFEIKERKKYSIERGGKSENLTPRRPIFEPGIVPEGWWKNPSPRKREGWVWGGGNVISYFNGNQGKTMSNDLIQAQHMVTQAQHMAQHMVKQ